MKIIVPIVIQVDPATWAENNGLCDLDGRFSLASVRDDLRTHVINNVRGLALLIESDAEVNPS